MTPRRPEEAEWVLLALAAALALLVLLAAGARSAEAQQQMQTLPSGATTNGGNASSTITSTGAFQLVWSGAGNSIAPVVGTVGARHGCTIQNNGTHVMYVTEAIGVAASTTAKAAQVPASGGVYHCADGVVVLVGEIDITGTAGDTFYAAQY